MDKLCRSCGKHKLISSFHVYKKTGSPRPDCKDCHNMKSLEYRKAHPEEARAALAKSRALHLEQRHKDSKVWRENNRPMARQLTKEWMAKNRPRIRAKNKLRRAQHLGVCPRCWAAVLATPKWLSYEQRQEISNMYMNCPIGMQVDHILPIRGKEVCGLNVPWNLQYLTAQENTAKGNRING